MMILSLRLRFRSRRAKTKPLVLEIPTPIVRIHTIGCEHGRDRNGRSTPLQPVRGRSRREAVHYQAERKRSSQNRIHI